MTKNATIELPTPTCRMGYTEDQLAEILGDHLNEFGRWMNGQTMSICDGRSYNHEKRSYETSCEGVSHGVIVYSCDLKRFLAKLPPLD